MGLNTGIQIPNKDKQKNDTNKAHWISMWVLGLVI